MNNVPGAPIGRTYDGGSHGVSAEEILAYAEATDDANPAYRGPDAVAMPMFHVRPFNPLLWAMASDADLGLDLLRLVHAEHGMSFARPLRPGDELRFTGELVSLEDKPSGRIAAFAVRGHVGGELVLDGRTSFFIRAASPGPKAPKPPAEAPPAPTFTVEQRVAPDQARRYAEASGDRNPIHLDPAVAAAAGLPGVILHGLCTLAFAQRDLVDRACGGDPARLASLSVRWAKPVLLDQTLVMSVWDEGRGDWSFSTAARDGAVASGKATVRPPA